MGGDPECVNETRAIDSTNSSFSTYEIVPHYPELLFSVGVFFGLMAALLGISLMSFLILHFHPECKKELISDGEHKPKNEISVYELKKATTFNETGAQLQNQYFSEFCDDLSGQDMPSIHPNSLIAPNNLSNDTNAITSLLSSPVFRSKGNIYSTRKFVVFL